MIDLNEAYSSFRESRPQLTVMLICDYDAGNYLFQAQENPDEVDYNDPFYLVSKTNGSIKPFSPLEDLDHFTDAMANRQLEIPEAHLEHHGIRGQKWGVRRFQNEDGSLTEAGRKRYLKSLRDGIHAVKNVEDLPDSPAKQAFKDAADESAKAYKEYFDKRHALATEYWDNRDAVRKYSTKLAENTWDDAKKILGWKDSQKSEWINSHLNGDFDQGDSFDLWLKDQGSEYKSLMALSKKHIDAANRAEALGAEYVRSMLGQYADMPVTQAVKLKMKTPQDPIRRNEYKRTTLAKAIPSYYVFEREMSHSDFLMHHGIKGQKWGVRRFQNDDGSLTLAGKARYLTGTAASKLSDFRAAHAERKKEAVIAKGNAKQVSRYAKKLSTQELRAAIERIELTQRVNELSVKPKTYKLVAGLSNLFTNTARLHNSVADAAEAVKRVRNLLGPKEDEEAAALKKGRLAGLEAGAKLKAKDEVYPGKSSKDKQSGAVRNTKTKSLNDRIANLSNKDRDEIVKTARSPKAEQMNKRIWELRDADTTQRDSSVGLSYSQWHIPKAARDTKAPSVSSEKFGKRPLDLSKQNNRWFNATKLSISVKQVRDAYAKSQAEAEAKEKKKKKS